MERYSITTVEADFPSAAPTGHLAAESSSSDAWRLAKNRLGAIEYLLQDTTAMPGIIGEAAAYHLSTGGKRFRPLFMLAVGEALNCDHRTVRQLAVAVELLHNASLVHDDLQDKDQYRRGKETVWWRFGSETAVNLGDYFISSTYLSLSRIELPHPVTSRLVGLFAESSRRVIAGQSAELEASGRLDVSPDVYLRIARGKSGVLMALPVVSVLMAVEADVETIHHARQAMEWLGASYQIQDDLADLFGRKEGRDAGTDIKMGRSSLPIVFFHKKTDAATRTAFEAFIAQSESARDEDIRHWVARIQQSDAIRHCREVFDSASRKASRHLSQISHPILRQTLVKGVDMVLSAMTAK